MNMLATFDQGRRPAAESAAREAAVGLTRSRLAAATASAWRGRAYSGNAFSWYIAATTGGTLIPSFPIQL